MPAPMDRLVDALTGLVRRHVPPSHVQLLVQFIQFGTVGTAGFVVDTAVVYGTRLWAGLYLAGILAYAAAVTTTWWLNRIWTFRDADSTKPKHHQWATFVVATLPGLCFNLGSYFLLVSLSPLCAAHPEIAIAAGAVAGMFANFTMSRSVVFR